MDQPNETGRERLGIYLDTLYRRQDEGKQRLVGVAPPDAAFVGIFLPEVAKYFDSLWCFGRTLDESIGDYVALPPNVKLVELPHYPSLWHLPGLLHAAVGSARKFWRTVDCVDALWVFGPHPLGLLFIGLAVLKRKKVILGVRQQTITYFRARMPSRVWAPVLVGVYGLDSAYRLLARYLRTVVTGPEIARSYGQNSRVYVMTESVIRRRDMKESFLPNAVGRVCNLLTVSRLDPEKNPLLLISAVAKLNEQQRGSFRLTWIGNGPMDQAMRERAAELGVADDIEFRGFVPFGTELLEAYQLADIFVHVSFTEGVPKVIVEALANATPVVATDVGGVRDLLDGGRAGLLVPVGDLDSLVSAIRRIAHDASLRRRLVAHGLSIASHLTIEVQSKLVAEFIAR